MGHVVEFVPSVTSSQTVNILLLPVLLARARLRGFRILHLHWVHGFAFPKMGGTASALISELWFRLSLRTAAALRLRVVWTAHNVLPHERVFADDRRARRLLLRRVSAVIVHSEVAARELSALFGGPLPCRATIIPIGSYEAAMANPVSQEEGLLRLGLLPAGITFLFFGLVAEYKGVEDLLASALRLSRRGLLPADTRLMVVGRCSSPQLEERLRTLASEVEVECILNLQRVDDDEVPCWFGAADVVVLPFRRVTTSSSVLLPAAFNRLVLLPELAGAVKPSFSCHDLVSTGVCRSRQGASPSAFDV